MPNYVVWTKHGERGVIMEDVEEDDDNIPDWTQKGAFADDPMGEDYDSMEETQGASDPLDDLGEVLRDAKEDCERVKESKKFEHILEVHKKPLYLDCKEGRKMLSSTLEMLQWKAKNGVYDEGFDELMMIIKDMLL
jgi:hypothetical protein